MDITSAAEQPAGHPRKWVHVGSESTLRDAQRAFYDHNAVSLLGALALRTTGPLYLQPRAGHLSNGDERRMTDCRGRDQPINMQSACDLSGEHAWGMVSVVMGMPTRQTS